MKLHYIEALPEIFRRMCGLAYFIALMVAPPGLAQEKAGTPVEVRLERGGRTIVITAPGLAGFQGGFAARVVIEGVTNVLSSASGTPPDSISSTAETTPYGVANVSSCALRFERENVDLLFRLDQIPGVPVVMLQAGIRNTGARPVNLLAVAPLAMDDLGMTGGLLASCGERSSALTFVVPTPKTTGMKEGAAVAFRQPALVGGFSLVGNPAEWLVTGLNNRTPVLSPLGALKGGLLDVFECGSCFRQDGVGFLFGPVGTPVAYVTGRLVWLGGNKAGLSLIADMSGVRVEPGQVRWGQQVALFMESPSAALVRWTEWVARTHGARLSRGALSGWSSWYFLERSVTGKDVLDVAGQVTGSDGRLRPAVIQIDGGYERLPGDFPEMNSKFPLGLSAYARAIAAPGCSPGLKLDFLYPVPVSLTNIVRHVACAIQAGYSYLKMGQFVLSASDERQQTAFERYRDCFAEIRRVAGDNTYLLHNDWTQNRAALGYVDAARCGFEAKREGLRTIIGQALRAYQFNGRWFAVDNDVYYMATELKDVSPVVGGWPLARTWISMVGLSCGAAFTSDPWNEERFKPYWRNVEVLTPPARERTEVLDLCTGSEWPRLVGHVAREWGNWTVALLWNPADREQDVKLDFARIGLDPKRRYAVWSFWDNRYLGVAEGSYTTPSLAASASQHLSFTELPKEVYRPVVIGSSLHIYCGAAELKRVTSLHSGMQIELTDAGARDGDLFIYSQFEPVVKDAAGCVAGGIAAAGENVWKLSLKGRRFGDIQRVELGIPQPVTRQAWFWLLVALLAASLAYSGWRYVVAAKLQRERALEQERLRIARDIHDEVGASLTKIGRLASRLPDPDIAETTRGVVQAMDEIVWAVNPCNDTLEKMASYLVHYAEGFVRPAGISLELDVPFSLPHQMLSADVRHNVFMVVKEALNNAVKHGSPGRIQLGLALEGDVLTVVVRDNGRGFSPAAASDGADGLANMRQRLAAIRGLLDVQSLPGKGTTVTVKVALGGTGKAR